jgi:hypothetical protein
MSKQKIALDLLRRFSPEKAAEMLADRYPGTAHVVFASRNSLNTEYLSAIVLSGQHVGHIVEAEVSIDATDGVTFEHQHCSCGAGFVFNKDDNEVEGEAIIHVY